jgi:RNA 3'-terminal phosphate cyclase
LRTSEVTTHLLTNADVIRQFLPVDISVTGKPGEAATISVMTR